MKSMSNLWMKAANKAGLEKKGATVNKRKLLDIYAKLKGCSHLTATNHFNNSELDRFFTRPTDRSRKGQLISLRRGIVNSTLKEFLDRYELPTEKKVVKKIVKKTLKTNEIKLNKEVAKLYKEAKQNYIQVTNMNESQTKIAKKCQQITKFLLDKNEQYGDSALTPIRIFSKSDDKEQLKVRIDDKLNRLLQGNQNIEKDEDVIIDLIGYLILLLISMES